MSCSKMPNKNRKTGYVAHFDMLGFSRAVEGNPEAPWTAINLLHERQLQIPTQKISIKSTKQIVSGRVKTVFFSATIIIYTQEDEYEDYISIFSQSSNLFMHSLIAGIPLRGGIADGDFFVDLEKGLYMGVPFIKAYNAGEKVQWLGIVIDPDTYTRRLKDISQIAGEPYFVMWNIPIKNGKSEQRIVVNWPWIYEVYVSLPHSVKELYERGFEDLFGPFDKLDSSVKCKYENTIDFINNQSKKAEQ